MNEQINTSRWTKSLMLVGVMTCVGGVPKKRWVSHQSKGEQIGLWKEELNWFWGSKFYPTSNYTFKEPLKTLGKALVGDSALRLYWNWEILDSEDGLSWQMWAPCSFNVTGALLALLQIFEMFLWSQALSEAILLLAASLVSMGALAWSLLP